ncbi:CRE-CHS-2 protein [Aphelenchoides avenae]|nr:CRE-CHS-2 protein [Aphelenchus avenae]
MNTLDSRNNGDGIFPQDYTIGFDPSAANGHAQRPINTRHHPTQLSPNNFADVRHNNRHVQKFSGFTGSPEDVQSIGTESRSWDIFRLLPPKPDKVGKGFWHDISIQVLKISTFFVLLVLTLLSAFVAKSTFLLMTSAIGYGNQNMTICTDKIPEAKVNTIFITNKHVTKWIWSVYLALCAPEIICFLRSFHRTMFRNVRRPSVLQFLTVLLVESLHAFGVGTLVFRVMPSMPADTSAMLSNGLCLVPSILTALSRRANRWFLVLVVLDCCAIAAQSTGFWAWPALVPEIRHNVLIVVVCTTFISAAWWQNFIHPASFLPPIRSLAKFAGRLTECRSKTYVLVSLCKCAIYFFCIFYYLTPQMALEDLVQRDPFGEKLITITARDLNQTQISRFLQRMREYDRPVESRAPSSSYNRKSTVEDVDDEVVKVPKKKTWNPDEDDSAIDAGDYEKTPKAKKKGREDDEKMIEVDGEQKSAKKKPKKGREKRAYETQEDSEEEQISAYNIYEDYVELNQFTTPYDALWVALVQICSVIVCYHSSKFACKVCLVSEMLKST